MKPTLRLALRAVLAAVLATTATLRAQDAASLALPERRALKQYQETKLPALQKAINDAAKFEVPLEVKWGSIAQKDQGDRYLEDD